jgi:hypothetical protein
MPRTFRSLAVLMSFALVLALPLQAHAAAVTWATAGTFGVAGTCSAATMDAPTLVTQGLPLAGLHNLVVSYESTTGNLTATTGKLLAYWWNPQSGRDNKWERAKDLDLAVGEAADSAVWAGITVVSALPGSRIAYVPSAIGQAGKVYIQGAK